MTFPSIALCFRRVNPAASLKLAWRTGRRCSIPDSFRRVNPAASLKQQQLELIVHGVLKFPPGKSRRPH